ncbi:MAG: MotA/TolQ/ExbB proton channel family protein [Phycisphaerae bacterium]
MNTRSRIIRRSATFLLAAILFTVASAAVAQPAEAAPETKNNDDQAQVEEMSILEILLKGGWFMIPIAACSLLAAAVVVERFMALQRKRVIPPGFLAQLQSVYRGGAGRKEAMEYCRANDSPLARLALAGLRKMHRGEKAIEEAIEDAGAHEVSKLRKNLRMLYAIAAVAPMLGLVGTVWGMIQAFQVASQQGLGRATSLAKGIYEALVTTFGGLVVAIPVLIFYYFFLGRIERLVHEMNEQSVELIEGALVIEEPAPASAQPDQTPTTAPATA